MRLAPRLWGLDGVQSDREDLKAAQDRMASMLQVRVRQYQDLDREEVRRICCDTGFLGNPIDRMYHDRELFADLFTNPYLDYEPEWTLVAESAGRVVGYLTGSVDPHFNRTLMRSGFQTACKMVSRLITGKYSQHPRSEQFVRWVLTRGLKEQPKHPDGASHLHANLEKPWRWGALARRLLTTFESMLLAVGVNHYYAKFFSCPQRNPERLYDRLGFQIYDRMQTTIFRPEIPDTVYIICVQKRLERAGPCQ
jgi:GNAT superfamily N-acetyltransferase